MKRLLCGIGLLLPLSLAAAPGPAEAFPNSWSKPSTRMTAPSHRRKPLPTSTARPLEKGRGCGRCDWTRLPSPPGAPSQPSSW